MSALWNFVLGRRSCAEEVVSNHLLGGEDILPVEVEEDKIVADSHHEERSYNEAGEMSLGALFSCYTVSGCQVASSSSEWGIGGILSKISRTKIETL